MPLITYDANEPVAVQKTKFPSKSTIGLAGLGSEEPKYPIGNPGATESRPVVTFSVYAQTGLLLGLLDIAQLQQDGQRDSSGRFSWDSSCFAELLTKLKLADPYEYVLRAVATAVSGQATWFRFKRSRGGVELSWDGQPFTLEELTGLMPGLLDGVPLSFRLRELTVAVVAAAALYDEIRLSSGQARLTRAAT